MKKVQEFEKNSIVLFVLMMSANVCNYLFQIIVGNLLSVEDYGVVNTVVSLIGIFSIPTTIVTLITARYIAICSTETERDTVPKILNLLLKFVTIVSVVLVIIVLCGLNKITALFDIERKGYILGALLVGIVNLFFSITSGTLQGRKQFFSYGIQTIFVATGKLVLSIVLILIGWRIYGVIVAMIIGIIVAIIYGIIHMKAVIRKAIQYRGKAPINILDFSRYAFGVIVAQGCVIAITNGDVLLVKTYFSETDTGIYSSAAVIGKIAMYVSTAVVAALFPMVVELHENGKNTIPLLKKALLYGGGMALICGLGMSFLGKYIICILFGERYTTAILYLPYVCIFVIPLTFVTILMNYVLAIGKTKMFGISTSVALVSIIVFSTMMHDTIGSLMVLSGTILTVLFLENMLYLYYSKKDDIV